MNNTKTQTTKRQDNFARLTVQEKRDNPQIIDSEKLGRTLVATTRIELHPSESVTNRAPTFRCAVLFRGAVVALFKPTRSTTTRSMNRLLKRASDFVQGIAEDHDCAAFTISEEVLQYNFHPAKMAASYVLGPYTQAGAWIPTFEK
jgi:hypothetical protein